MNEMSLRGRSMSNTTINRAATAVVAVIIGLLQGCAPSSQRFAPLTAENHDYGTDPNEAHLIDLSKEAHLELRNRGLLYRDAEVVGYLNALGQRLAPQLEQNGLSFQFFVLKNPAPNAMAMPNGNVYVTLGLLSLLENEAQLASVLAHEISHVVYRHSLKSLFTRKNTIVAANLTDVLLLGTGLGNLGYGASLALYSREQEEEADTQGLVLLHEQGYQIAQATRAFELLQNTHPEQSGFGSIYSSHPDDAKRIGYVNEMIAMSYPDAIDIGFVGEEEYQAIWPRAFEMDLQICLIYRKYRLVLNEIDRATTHYDNAPLLDFYRAEAYRGMADHPLDAADEKAWMEKGKKASRKLIDQFESEREANYVKAEEFYRAALAANPQLSKAHRGIGLIAMTGGRQDEAIVELGSYLLSSDKLPDRRHIERLLRDLRRGTN